MTKFNRRFSPDNPCPPECPERNAECHAKCRKYLEWRKELDRKNAERRKKMVDGELFSDAKKHRLWKKQRYSAQNMKHHRPNSDR